MRFFPLVVVLLVAACSGGEVRDTLGLRNEAPDEFVVVSRPPLTVPPDFELRPPSDGAAPAASRTREQARSLLLKGNAQPATLEEVPQSNADTAVVPVLASDTKSNAEARLLSRTGAVQADPEIREKLGSDMRKPAPVQGARSLLEKIEGKKHNQPVVDAKKESERLRKALEKGEPVNQGKVPETTTKSGGILESIF